MNRLPMSPAASALLRALIARGRVSRDRILLTESQSIEWRSLTFTGERHQLSLRITGPGASAVAGLICGELADAEFSIPHVIVADIGLLGGVEPGPDGSVSLTIEALTVSED